MSAPWLKLRAWKHYEDERKQAYRTIFDCQHKNTVLRRMTVRGGSFQYRYQCLDCGVADGKAAPKPEWAGAVKDFDEEFAKLKADERAGKFPDLLEQLHNEWFSLYNLYLDSPEWKTKRLVVITRAKGICEGCGKADATQVHHLNYEHVTQELLFELVAICDACHKVAHEKTA